LDFYINHAITIKRAILCPSVGTRRDQRDSWDKLFSCGEGKMGLPSIFFFEVQKYKKSIRCRMELCFLMHLSWGTRGEVPQPTH
jgi:hypothetical protein